MNEIDREKIIKTVIEREQLRPIGRFSRLLKDPLRAFPYYILAAISHLKPFKLRFKTLWVGHMSSYLPEGNTFFYYGFCEANLTNFFLRFVDKGMTVVDIGAHVGIYSMLSSKLVGETGKVHSFEPTPWTFSLLKENTADMQNVTINNLAVSEKPTSLHFADYGPGYGAYNSAHKDGASLNKKPQHIEVKSISLDDYISQNNLTPDLIKIDAEGFESHILKGATKVLKEIRPLLVLEVANGESWADNRNDAFAILKENSYMPYEMNVAGKVQKHNLQNSYTYDNLLFVPEEKEISVVKFLSS